MDAGACSLTKAVLRYTAPVSMQETCLRKCAGVAYACRAPNRFSMMSLLVVLPNEFADSAPLPGGDIRSLDDPRDKVGRNQRPRFHMWMMLVIILATVSLFLVRRKLAGPVD